MSSQDLPTELPTIDICEIRPRTGRHQTINVAKFPKGERSDVYVPMYERATGNRMSVPFIVARGHKDGPVLGITAAVHGNELNGIRIIHHVLRNVDLSSMSGTLLCVPIVNIPGFNAGSRYFTDGLDLNTVFPGKPDGQPAEQYARAFTSSFLPACDYLIDLHTASEGRLNTFYVRTDWLNDKTRELAVCANPAIILHSPKHGGGTLRNAARRRGIPAITIEAGNPSVFQGKMVIEGEAAIQNIMILLGMVKGKIESSSKPVVCHSSKWLRTTGGGILETTFKLGEKLQKKHLVAITRDAFDRKLQEYYVPEEGIVIGKAAYPVAIPGTRFCHLGSIGEPSAGKPKKKQE
ncbi:MAG: succinylglutamate desuccinylase/aspartoacylase family protein [Bdellovibrionales bacterium]|nr:succinylglutamate desuccinylase/aspartoacylase family protein [Bdellovibrionales bacterium]